MVLDVIGAVESDARWIALAGPRTILDIVEKLESDFDCDVREGCDPELLPRLMMRASMAFARMNEVRSEKPETGDDFREVSYKLAKTLLEVASRTQGTEVKLAELATCFFYFCTAEQQANLAIYDPFFKSANSAIRRADADETEYPTAASVKILTGKDSFELILEFAAAMTYRGERGQALTDCVFTHLLNQASMWHKRRRAFIFLFLSWLPYQVEEIDLFTIRRIVWSSWVPLALKLAILSYCSPLKEYDILPKVFGLHFGPEVREAMCSKLEEPVRAYLDAILADAR